ncbi:MAG: YggS family pyridoxal phosphate-dependent enzyme [Candidatus Omnitrophica bacterium]|nr:YggS family pyridoxal phosphate-dependent enzyme [Candidatus Omnitrophota bacterium]
MLSENLARVRARIRQACHRCGRDPASVTLVCVTKGIAIEAIQEAVSLGVTDLGENRVQEAKPKRAAFAAGEARWHLIGHLQRNKAKDAIGLFGVIHSLDSVALAEELERQAAKRQQILDALVQVNVSGEATKFGCTPAEAPSLAQAIGRLPHLRLMGLMTMAPFVENPEHARPYFRRLRLLREELLRSSLLLSMGMSNDFEVAIEEGADFVRIGSAIFKP